MSVVITNETNSVVLKFFGSTHVFQKEDLTLQKFDSYLIFQDARQKQKVIYSDVTLPTSNNIDDLTDIIIGYINSRDKTSESIDLGNYYLNNSLNCILDELKKIKLELKKINE